MPSLIIAASGWGNMLAKPSAPIHKLQRKILRRLFIHFATYIASLVYCDLISSPRNENIICLPEQEWCVVIRHNFFILVTVPAKRGA